MRPISRLSLTLLFFFASQILAAQVPNVVGAELKSKTLEGFSRYVRATEARIKKELARPDEFLYIDELSEPRRVEVRTALQRGEIFMEPLRMLDASGREIRAPGGLIHHWVGDVFIRGASVRQVLDLVQDYSHHQDVYKPEVVRSRLISRERNDFKIALRFREKKVITVTLNTEHDVRYTRVDATHWYSRSASTRIAQVENADKPREREEPVGHDGGFLWRINSYWRFVERDGGVYVECEAVSLTRDIPTGLGWLIRPFITSIPKESLEHTLGSTRAAVLARVRSQESEEIERLCDWVIEP